KKSIPKNASFDPLGDGGQDLIGNGAGRGGEPFRGIVPAEDQDPVPFDAIDSADIHHDHVHADIAYDRRPLPVDQHRGPYLSVLSANAIGMAQGKGWRSYVALGGKVPVVARRTARPGFMDLGDDGPWGGHWP